MAETRTLLALLLSFTLMSAACGNSGSGTTPSGTGGSHASGGQSSGGTPGAGGKGSGGSVGTGGAVNATGGAAGNGGSSATGGSTGKGGNAGNGGAATAATGGDAGQNSGGTSGDGGARTGGASGSAGASAAGGATATGGTSTSSSAGGTTSSGGTTGKGGASGGTGGAGGSTTAGGTTGSGGTTGAGTGGATSTGGTSGGTSVVVSPTCKAPTWPSPTGSPVTLSKTMSVTDYDGKGALHEGSFNDCSLGDQDSTTAMFEVADGGSVKNVIFGKKIGDGIHCLGSCTIDNVWFPYICDDAITINKDGDSTKTSTVSNCGFKGARDKTIQHNGGDSTLNISNVYVEVAGKLYRSCGSGGGCTTSAKHTVNVSNVVAIGVNQIVGISTNDHATLSNICTFRNAAVCNTYKVNSDDDSTVGANGTGEGPSANCSYKASDVHGLVDRVTGATLTTDVPCPGPNSVKSGTSPTACITGFEKCLKTCAPGMYGFKEMSCSGGNYASADTAGCALVAPSADSEAASALAGTNASKATSTVTKNNACTSQWAWGKDSSNDANYCVCVEKPGYYQKSSGAAQPNSWIVWDCQSQWW